MFCFCLVSFYIIIGYTKSDISQEIIYIHVCLQKVILHANRLMDCAHWRLVIAILNSFGVKQSTLHASMHMK